MTRTPGSPTQLMPAALAAAVDDLPWWFVIGGQAVRCFCPYRPSVDVDFGVPDARRLGDLLKRLEHRGAVALVERSSDTVHLLFNGIKVSIFVLDKLEPFVVDRHLDVTGLLATKLHAILDRGTRRDFFDLYVIMQREQLGLAEALTALRQVYRQEINQSLLLRALTFFDDAEREGPLPGEGARDWQTVTDFFLRRVGELIVPPGPALAIQQRAVEAAPRGAHKKATRERRRTPRQPRPR